MKFDECNHVSPDLYDDLDCAKKGRLNSYLQGMMQRECSCLELSREEQAQVRRIQVVLQNVLQWSDEEAVQAEMAEQDGQVLFVSASRNSVLVKPSLPVRKSFHGVAVYF